MHIVTEDQHRVLAFIAACNRNHYNPTADQAGLWQENPEPREAVYRDVRREVAAPAHLGEIATAAASLTASRAIAEFQRPMRGLMRGFVASAAFSPNPGSRRSWVERKLVSKAETTTEHLVRLAWLEQIPDAAGEEPRLRLTELGTALLRHAETGTEADEDVSVVVLGGEDPLAYPTLVGLLAAAGPGLLVDAYLKLHDLHTLVVSTQLTRLLVSGRHQNSSEVAALQTYVDNPSLSRRVEIRASTQLHDRVLVADDGDVLTLGASLNGVGRKTTVLSPMPSPAREALKVEYERLWSEATPVGPAPTDEHEELKTDSEQESPDDHEDP